MAVIVRAEMTELETEADRLMEVWAAWQRATRLPQLDYPAKTNFAVTVTGTQEYDDAEAEMMEAALLRLKNNRRLPKSYEALEQRYVYGVISEQAAARLGVGKRKYYDLIHAGLAYIEGFLDMAENQKNARHPVDCAHGKW